MSALHFIASDYEHYLLILARKLLTGLLCLVYLSVSLSLSLSFYLSATRSPRHTCNLAVYTETHTHVQTHTDAVYTNTSSHNGA